MLSNGREWRLRLAVVVRERQTMRFLISRGGVAVLVHRCPSDWPAAARYACAGVPFLVRVLNFIIKVLFPIICTHHHKPQIYRICPRFLFPSVSIGTARSLFIHPLLILASGWLVISSHLPLCSGTAGQ